MSSSALSSTQINMTCAICRDIYRAPRFLPCHHSFCLVCLEQLAERHGNVTSCPTCRASARIPLGGVRALQVNFYFTEEVLEQARREGIPSMCSVHTKECVIFHCTQCDQAICLRCKLTKHEGHVTEDLSEAAVRCQKKIENEMSRLGESVKRMSDKVDILKQNEKRALEKRDEVLGQIQGRYDDIVAMAHKYRCLAIRQLEVISDNLEKNLAADTQRVQDELNSLLQLQDRAQHALSSSCDTEVLQVEREITRGGGNADRLKELESTLPYTSYRPGLHGDFTNDIEDNIKRYIGSPVKLSFDTEGDLAMDRVGRCGDGKCCEVHSLSQTDNEIIEIFYGGTGGDFRKEKNVVLYNDGSRSEEEEYGMRIACVSRKGYQWRWENPAHRNLSSKDEGMYAILQNCSTNSCYISSMKLKQKCGKEQCEFGTTLIRPRVQKIHNFDSNKEGSFFAVVDEDESKNSNNESKERNVEDVYKSCSRVVRVYSNKSNDPIATYTSPIQPFFPTDVCFHGTNLLLIADWMNDCVHVAKVTDTDVSFVDYLPGCGDIVRPTALNLNLNGQLLIGCGDGWVLKNPVEICSMFDSRKRNSHGLSAATDPKRKRIM